MKMKMGACGGVSGGCGAVVMLVGDGIKDEGGNSHHRTWWWY